MKLAKVEAVYRPNILINGDFKINPRGQTRYEISNTWTYTFAMWRGNGWMSIEKTVNGIKIQNNSDINSAQWFSQKFLSTKNGVFTLSLNVLSKSGKAVVKFESDTELINSIELNVGHNVLTTNCTGLSQIVFEIGGSTTYGDSIEIEYVDLFEGDIAYEHIEEDEATALMRCEKYLKIISIPSNGSSNINLTSGSINAIVPFGSMVSTPTAIVYDIDKNKNKISRLNIGYNTYTSDVISNFYANRGYLEVISNSGENANALAGWVEFSCEP